MANRGEIALRVMRTVRAQGLGTVAVYSDADADLPFVEFADVAVPLDGNTSAETYLDADKVLDAAVATGADAIHPGYGFLSENADFARACAKRGVTFIGPTPSAIEIMANKRAAKELMSASSVPCIPGFAKPNASDDELVSAGDAVGLPIMVKAADGGGGRGMRLVRELDDLASAIQSARTESLNAFASDELILERAIVDGRHIEVQVAADDHGNVVHLFERDCSVQRRHQKVIEEAPSPFVTPALRAEMGAAAVNAARACDYRGVGTVEFLVDADGGFYFLEMNTRLQVEHPVTELITGIDLVAWQLAIAAGEPLPASQDELAITGHAIETRIYAEDPARGFLPQTGRIHAFDLATADGIRNDTGFTAGVTVSPYYDSMLAKVIAYGDNREMARRRLDRALGETRVLGLTTNTTYLRELLNDPRFVAGEATTALIDESNLPAATVDTGLVALAIVVHRRSAGLGEWLDWSNAAPMTRRDVVALGDDRLDVLTTPVDGGYRSIVESAEHHIRVESHDAHRFVVVLDGVRREVGACVDGDSIHIEDMSVRLATYDPVLGPDAAGDGRIKASTEGLVISIQVAPGDQVAKGESLVVVEAMKMEHRHVADGDGVVKSVNVTEGVQVTNGQLLVELELEEVE